MRVCSIPDCPNLFKGKGSRCPEHAREYERTRGTRQQRGYGSEHDKLRAQWVPKVATGRVACARCHERIQPGTPWDLGHTDDRTAWTGPEHTRCNRAAGGRNAHR